MNDPRRERVAFRLRGDGVDFADRDAVGRHLPATPIYLETGSETTRDALLRHGYDPVGEVRLPGRGPRMWTLISCPHANARTASLAAAGASR